MVRLTFLLPLLLLSFTASLQVQAQGLPADACFDTAEDCNVSAACLLISCSMQHLQKLSRSFICAEQSSFLCAAGSLQRRPPDRVHSARPPGQLPQVPPQALSAVKHSL